VGTMLLYNMSMFVYLDGGQNIVLLLRHVMFVFLNVSRVQLA